MKVYLTSTPEFPVDVLERTVDLLKRTPGIIDFINAGQLTSDQLALIDNRFGNQEPPKILTFEEFIHICHSYRVIKNIAPDCFVVVISSIENDLDWFSAFKNKDVFIHGAGWEIYSKRSSEYALAFQVVENVFQSLSAIKIGDQLVSVHDYTNTKGIPDYMDMLVHQLPVGCINDFCVKKEDINIKFLTGHICPDCRRNAMEKIPDVLIYNHLRESFSNLRDYYVEEDEIDLPPVTVTEIGKVFVGNREIDFQPLLKSFYIFFLRELPGVPTSEVYTKLDEIYSIYQKVRRGASKHIIARNLDYSVSSRTNRIGLYDPLGGRFRTARTKVNEQLCKSLGSQLSLKYQINNYQQTYKIELDSAKINLAPTFR